MSIRKQSLLLFGCLMFCYAYIHQHPGPNQNSRIDLLRGLFFHHTFRIDADHNNTIDKATHDGHYYSDKAPGIAFMAVPAFAFAVGLMHTLDIPVFSSNGRLMASWMATVGSVGLITALGGVAFFVFLSKLIEQRFAFITTFCIFLGGAPLPYATMLFSHAAVVGLICISLWGIGDSSFFRKLGSGPISNSSPVGMEDSTGRAWCKRHAVAGFCSGLAVSSEYTAAPAVAGVLLLAGLVSFRRAAVVALCAFFPLLLIPIYNSICFGDPLAFGYHNLAVPEFQEMNHGLFGITWPPKLSSAYLILFSPSRGLFFWTPFFLMAIAGLPILFRLSRSLFWTALLVLTVHTAAISGYFMPGGGGALGPRHLAPMLPFAAILCALGLSRFPRMGLALGLASILLTATATLLDAMPPDEFADPLLSYYLPGLMAGKFQNTIGSLLFPFPDIAAGVAVLVIAFTYFLSEWHYATPKAREV